jgi:hypothetical protein
MLDQATCIGQLEARRNRFAAPLQEPQPFAKLSTDQCSIPPSFAVSRSAV